MTVRTTLLQIVTNHASQEKARSAIIAAQISTMARTAPRSGSPEQTIELVTTVSRLDT